uniref:Taste receptor type 2 n=1 Tax=Monodelphis domestica TaxID=13616 RepID=A0A5F8HI72_MONDO
VIQLIQFGVWIVALTQLLTGIVGNLLIMIVNCKAWIKSRKLSSFDRILSSLSITRCISLSLMFLHLIFSLIFPKSKYPELMALIILNSWLFLDSCSLWIVTLLNIFYCVKIANLNHLLFLWIKRNLSLKTPWPLLACISYKFCSTKSFSAMKGNIYLALSVCEMLLSCTRDVEEKVIGYVVSYIILFLYSLHILYLSNISLSMLIINLKRHCRRMWNHMEG